MLDADDADTPYRHQAERALLGPAAHPEDLQAACLASGEDTWEAFSLGLDMAVSADWCEQVAFRDYRITAAGRLHGAEALSREHADRAAGRLTRREASAAHADLNYQHVIAPDHPLARKLWAMMHGQDANPLTAAEAELLAAHVALQSGPVRQALIDRLTAISAGRQTPAGA